MKHVLKTLIKKIKNGCKKPLEHLREKREKLKRKKIYNNRKLQEKREKSARKNFAYREIREKNKRK